MTEPDETPSHFHASPAEIDAFLRRHFAQDVLQNFYRAVGDEVLDEITTSGKKFRALKEQGEAKHVYLSAIDDVLAYVYDDRYFPAQLPKLGAYDRPFNPPRTTATREDAPESDTLGPEARRCFIKRPHEPHRWMFQRRAVPCPGNP